MTFANTITTWGNSGNKKVHRGTWTTDTTGGDIDTGLNVCEFITLTPLSATSSTEDAAVNVTFPCAGTTVTIVVTTGVDGYWEATGY